MAERDQEQKGKACCGKCRAEIDPAETKPGTFGNEKVPFCCTCAPEGCREVAVPVPGGGFVEKFKIYTIANGNGTNGTMESQQGGCSWLSGCR